MRNFDVAIIGGGVIGCSLARALAGEGVRVAVVERGAPGQEASWAAAGMLAPSAEAEQQSPIFALGRASIELYKHLAPDLASETGIDCEYRAIGSLVLFADEQERKTWADALAWQRNQGVPVQELSASELREREPQLAPFAGAFFLPGDHQVDNRLLMKALVQSCRLRGVEFILGKTALAVEGLEFVEGVERKGSRANGVRLENDRIQAGQVVNAAGSWAGSIRVPGLAAAPIRPVKATIDAVVAEPALAKFQFRAGTDWVDGGYSRTTIKSFYGVGQEDTSRTEAFTVHTDEPPVLLGENRAPNAGEYLLHALAACLTGSIVYHAAARGIALEGLECSVDGDVDLRGFLGLDDSVRPGYQQIRATITAQGDFDDTQFAELVNLSRYSPVRDSIINPVPLTIDVVRRQVSPAANH